MNKFILFMCFIALCHGQATKPPTKPPQSNGLGTKPPTKPPQSNGVGTKPPQSNGQGTKPPRPPHPPHPQNNNGPWNSIPGCNLTNYPKDATPKKCCETKPKCEYHNKTIIDHCRKNCSSIDAPDQKHCCFSKCTLQLSGLINADGTYNAQAAIDKFLASSGNPGKWQTIIQSVVKDCVAKGPAAAKEFLDKLNRTDTCGTAVNKAIEHCIAREFFLQCPESERNSTSEPCKKLFTFAKECSAWPFFGHHGHARNDNGGQGTKPPRTTNKPRPEGENTKTTKIPRVTKPPVTKPPQAANGRTTTTTTTKKP